MKSNQPLVSVILPCYNAMPFLPMALDSIVNQTYTNLEIICINDGSSDETPLVLEEYAKKDKRIRVIHNESNLKLIGTLNKAIALAKGEYIARMDADDISHLERIEKLLPVLVKENVDVVSCNRNFVDVTGKKIFTGYLKAISSLEIALASYFFTPIGHAMILAKRHVFIDFPYSYKDYSLHTEDYELWTRMVRNGIKFYNHNEDLYTVCINQNSVTRKFEEIQRANFAKSVQIHQESLLKRKLVPEIVAIASNRLEGSNGENFRIGFELIEEVYEKFKSENICDETENKSLQFIVSIQKTDIAIQIFKRGNMKLKFLSSWVLLKLILENILESRYRRYIFLKF